jgi:hypothetical protein
MKMKKTLSTIIAVTGGGKDERGRLLLSVMVKDGTIGTLAVTPDAAASLPHCLALAALASPAPRRA